VGLIYA
jgi:ubiquinone biosynthesis protein COQ4